MSVEERMEAGPAREYLAFLSLKRRLRARVEAEARAACVPLPQCLPANYERLVSLSDDLRAFSRDPRSPLALAWRSRHLRDLDAQDAQYG